MQSNGRDGRLDRRTLLKLSGLGLVGATAGCLEDSEGGGTQTTESGGSGDAGGDSGGDQTTEGGDGGDSGGQSSYTIGMVDALTGSLAPYGKRNQRGKDLALAAINDVGIGSEGAQLSVSVEDSESSNQSGVTAAQKLVEQNGVPLFIGAVGSGVSIAMYDSVTKGSGVVQISQNSTSPELTTRPGLLRTSPSGAAKGKALAELLAEDGHDNVAVTWVNNDYGSGLSEVFAENFEGNVSYNEPHDQGQSSYSGILTKMASTNASAWLFLTYANEMTVMANESFDQGYNTNVDYYGAESTVADEILANTPEGSLDGMKGITESAPQDQQNYKDFVSTFESEYDSSPTVWAAYAYDAVHIAALAIEAADEFSGSALNEVVRDVTRPEGQEAFTFEEAAQILRDGGSPSDVNYQGVSGPVDLDENGDPPGFYQVYSVANHSYEYGEYITS